MTGEFNDKSSADELFENYAKTIHLLIDRRLRSCTGFCE
jgi:hypothetical protein